MTCGEDGVGFSESIAKETTVQSTGVGVLIDIATPYGNYEWMEASQSPNQSIAGRIMGVEDVGAELPNFTFCGGETSYVLHLAINPLTLAREVFERIAATVDSQIGNALVGLGVAFEKSKQKDRMPTLAQRGDPPACMDADNL